MKKVKEMGGWLVMLCYMKKRRSLLREREGEKMGEMEMCFGLWGFFLQVGRSFYIKLW